MISKDTRAYEPLRKNFLFLTEGTVVCIDPSAGSYSSMPGWAVYKQGELVESGIFQLNPADPIPTRLAELVYLVRKLYNMYQPDILVYEDIPAQRHGGNAVAHATLLKSVGAILSVSGPRDFVGLMPISWKKMIRPEYVKGDEADAVEMGYVAISESRRIYEKDPPEKKKARKSKKKKKEA